MISKTDGYRIDIISNKYRNIGYYLDITKKKYRYNIRYFVGDCFAFTELGTFDVNENRCSWTFESKISACSVSSKSFWNLCIYLASEGKLFLINCFKTLFFQKIRLKSSPSSSSSYSWFLKNTQETEWIYWIWASFTFYNSFRIAKGRFLPATFEALEVNESFILCIKDSKMVYNANKPITSLANLNLDSK